MNITLPEQAMLTTILTQPYRTYHNINHINDCLTELRKYELSTNTRDFSDALENAIWYHDIIYNPYNPPGENERQSALAFISYKAKILTVYESYSNDLLYNVRDAIIATGYHTTGHPQIKNDDNYSNIIELMMDIDLSGLGKSSPIFYRNSINIIREYYNTPLIDIMKGRLNFLKTINLRPTFYYTEYFNDLYHTKSKDNVIKEIQLLENFVEKSSPEEYYYHINELAESLVC